MPTTTVADALAAAKLWLVADPPAPPPPAGGTPGPVVPQGLPYLATALYALVPVPSGEVARLAVDEDWRLYVNEEWALGVEVPAIGRELAHVVWHLLMDHATRARSMQVTRASSPAWHAAADLTVAEALEPDGLLGEDLQAEVARTRTDPGVIRLGRGRSAEEYYAVLSGLPAGTSGAPPPDPAGDPADDPTSCGSGCDGIPRGYELPSDDPAAVVVDAVDADRIRLQVAIDYQGHVTSRGSDPGDALRWARAVTEPTIPWEVLLTKAVRRAVGWASGRTEYTYTRPSRRQSAFPRVRLPGMRRPVPCVAVVLDTSASVDDTLLGAALGEVSGALAALGIAGAELTVYACDAAVAAVSTVRDVRDIVLAGGGGTDLRTGLDAAGDQRPRPGVIVVLTDGYTPWPATPPPGAAVIIGLLARAGDPLPPTPDWATRVECRLG